MGNGGIMFKFKMKPKQGIKIKLIRDGKVILNKEVNDKEEKNLLTGVVKLRRSK
jgi:hypothetical protein